MERTEKNIFMTEKKEHTVRYTDTLGREITLYGELCVPEREGRSPAVILCHGFNGHYTDFPTECARWGGAGYVCFTFDFCGAQSGGKSAGRTAEEYTPLTMVEDVKAVFRDMAALPTVDPARIFLFGGSQGGLVVSLAAADEELRDRIAGLAMYFPAFSIPENWHGARSRHTPLMGYAIGGAYIRSVQELDPYALIPAYPGDVCIVAGDRDPLVTGKTVERGVRAYGAERVALTILPGAGHGFVGEALKTAVERVLVFFEAHTDET